MKALLILRHAKSSWKDASLSDHDRPLNSRGEHDAPKMGKLIAKLGMVPDRILASTALRAQTTADLVAEHCGFTGVVELVREFYHAEPNAYCERLFDLDEAVNTVLVVGHNPGLEELLELLTTEQEVLPTAALAQVEFPGRSWGNVALNGEAKLIQVWRPKELPGNPR